VVIEPGGLPAAFAGPPPGRDYSAFCLTFLVTLTSGYRLPKGTHFAAWEQPEFFVDEIRASFRSLR